MIKETQNKMTYVFLVCSGFLTVLVLLYFVLGIPITKYTKKMKAEFKSKQNKLNESQELIRSFPDPQKAIEDMEKKSEELRGLGLTRKQIPRTIQMLAQAANKLDIDRVISIRQRDDVKSGNETLPAGMSKTYIEMTISCPYKLIGEYLKAITELPIAFNIEGLTIEVKGESYVPTGTEKAAAKAESKPSNLFATLLLGTYMVWDF